MREIDIWWSALKISEKERIARKGLMKETGKEEVDEEKVRYPACTTWWNGLAPERKQKIYSHCVGHHGDELPAWNLGNPYGD